MGRWVALLRGINVGGKNLVPMPALRACLEALGLADVATYIQSGNVVFASGERGGALAARIEAGLSKAFGYDASVVLRSAPQLRAVVDGAPEGFGARPALHRYDVIFLREPLTAAEALERAPARPGVDRVTAGPGVLYFSRLVREASRSRMSRLTALPIYRQMTIRNWNTTTRLLELVEGDVAPGSGRELAPRASGTLRGSSGRPGGARRAARGVNVYAPSSRVTRRGAARSIPARQGGAGSRLRRGSARDEDLEHPRR